MRIFEAYPNRVQARLEQRNRSLKSLVAVNGHSPHFIVNLSKRWQPGQSIRVAFRGGTPTLHRDIADTVTEWTQFANLNFDFGLDPATQKYRHWSTSDTSFAAEIRVSFDQQGYYSLVGNDSINPAITKPKEESLNLEGFDTQRPSDWKAVALHEFGHAIGFEHEHQNALVPCDFRFEDEPGYVPTTDSFGQFMPDPHGKRPGLYTLLGGPPNNWPKAVVDFNLRPLPDSSAYMTGTFDKDSIMKYFFPEWMFIAGASSACFSSDENLALSVGDKQGAAKLYPRDPQAINAANAVKTTVFSQVIKMPGLPNSAQAHIKGELDKIKKD